MRILFIEDEKDVVTALKNSLESDGFVVDVAKDGEEGSYLARTNKYDLMILDLVLPKKEGKEVLREIRSKGENLPVLVLSALTDPKDKIALLEIGADDYMIKPFSYGELLARVRALLRRSKKMIDEILKIDDLLVDTKRYSVKRGKQEIYLTRKELMLLEYLIRNKGIAMSRAVIMEHVWDKELDPFSNTIESHILKIRKKINLPGKKKLVHTIPGRGYMIDVREMNKGGK